MINLWASRSKSSDREVRGAAQVLQLIWAHKELRRQLEKEGWKKVDFMVNLNPSTTTTNGPSTRANGTYEDSTTPLLDRGMEMISAADRTSKSNPLKKVLTLLFVFRREEGCDSHE